jgi:serine/threonine-protein kinase
MNRDDYQQVKQIFHSALDIAPDNLADYLNEQCSDNTAIRQEVERLLDSHDSDYLEHPAIEAMAEEIVGGSFAAGEMVGHYRIVEKIGSGGMGEVFLAEDVELGRLAALKFLTVEFAEDEEHLHRFLREAKAVSALNHPNIMTVYEIGEIGGSRYIAAEYIRGVNLRQHMNGEPLDPGETLRIAVQIAAGLEAAHEAGIMHRDIKPDNVMIRDDGLVKVLDFGLAKHAPQADANFLLSHRTEPGMALGTVAYMSPEQTQGKTLDGRTDLWSLGVVLSEMLTGNQPFGGESKADTIAMILTEEPPTLDESIPEQLRRIVAKCLVKKTDERYQSARELLHDLKTFKHDIESSAAIENWVDSLQNMATDAGVIERSVSTGDQKLRITSTSAYLISQISSHKRGFAVALLVLISTIIGLGYWFFSNRSINTKQIESIAVMPFVNESGNADVEYLSDGMTETLINSLSKLSNLNVKARSTVFRYKGKGTDAQTIGKELNVQAILNGRVVQRGDQLTLSLELVDAQTENIIWSEQYNRKQTDLITLQSEIARDVSQKLKTKLSGADEQKLAKNYTENPEAYKHYLQGRFYWNKRTAENISKAIEQFKAAADKDPNYALAFAGLADCYAISQEYLGTPASEALPQAKAYANRALEIDDSLGEAHATLGIINQNSWNWAEAEKEYKRAIELNPNYATAHHWYARLLRLMGRSDEALAEIKRASELDPLSRVILNNLVQVYWERGEVDAAFEQCRKIIELDPDYPGAHLSLSYVYLKQGRTAEALAEAQKAVELSNRSNNGFLASLGYIQAISGNRNEALAVIIELEEKYLRRQADGFDIALIHTGLGRKDQAFAWLEKAFQDRSSLLKDLKTEPEIESLRSDPRYKDLLRRMNLPE